MKPIRKVFHAETKKLMSNRFVWITGISFFVVFSILLAVCVYRYPLYEYNERQYYDVKQYNNAAEYYESQRDYYKGLFLSLTEQTEDLPENHKFWIECYKNDYSYYEYLLETNTVKDDYVNAYYLSDTTENNRGSFVMLAFSKILFFPFLLFSALSALYVFSFEQSNGSVKNFFAAPIKRRDICFGKALFLFAELSIVFAAALLPALIFGLAGGGKVLIYGKNGWRAVSCVSVFLCHSAGTFVLMAVFAFLTLMLGQMIKKWFGAFSLSILLCGLSYAAFFIANDLTPLPTDKMYNKMYLFFPFVNLQNYYGGFTLPFFILLPLYILFASALFFVFQRKYIKQDF